ADTLYSSGTNQNLALASSEQWGRIPYFWSSGAVASYDIFVDYLDFTHSISGHIDSSGSGLENVMLDVGIHGSASTDVSGNYTISGIPWGMGYTVTPALSNYSFSPVSTSGTMTADVIADFSASLDLGIVAGVVEQNGTPVSGATVTLVTTAGTFVAVTSSNGSYSFGGLAPGTGTVTVEKNGVELVNEAVNVTAGTTVVPNVEISNPQLSSTLYTFWNGFLDMVNVLELLNPGTSELVVDVALHDIDGGVVATKQLRIPAGSQRDVIINDLPGFSLDSYGLVTVDAGVDEVDGRMTYYRLSGDSWGDEFDFVYSLELMPEMSGETTGVWNTHLGQQSSSSAAIFGALQLGTLVTIIPTTTPNWLSVANLDSVSRNFTITYRDQTGDSITTATLRIPPLGKRDIQAGHEFSDNPAVGLISITPENNSDPYIATLSRYGDRFAFTTATQPGNSAVVALPAGGEGLNVLELVNVSNATNNVELSWYDMNGELLKIQTAHLPAYSQQHFIPTDVLPEGSYGSVVIAPSANIIAGAASYLYDNTGEVVTAHYLAARESLGRVFSGTYNTYLGMYNWLRVTNNSAANQNAVIDFGGGGTDTVFIPAHGRRDALIPSGVDVDDTYGSFTLESTVPGVLSASVVRRREVGGVVDFQSVVGLR
ncbi:MAG: carboxypeptidase-like regulatory domain-containing protein, partial [bacterium]|nr:carboxypeptidase-like regulatory domain-containing protein [bacterium]